MTQTMTMILDGHLTAESPIHIVQPGAREVSTPEAKYRDVSKETVMLDGEVQYLLCIPSSTLRGGLRRAATAVATDAVQEAGGAPLFLADYLYNAVGGVKGDGKEDTGDVGRRAERRRVNPVVSLFGAATPWDRSRAYVESATADKDMNGGHVVRASVVGSRRTDDMATPGGIGAMLSGDPHAEWESLRGVAKEDSQRRKKVEALRSKAKGASSDEKARIAAEISDIQAEMSGGNSILMPLHHAVMPRGTVMRSRFVLKGVTAAEAGLFLEAMSRMWRDGPEIGGKIAHGYGRVSGSWTLRRDDGASESISAIPGQGLEGDPDGICAEALGAWADYIATGQMSLTAEA